MIELMKKNDSPVETIRVPGKKVRVFQKADRRKTIIVPHFSSFCSPPFTGTIMDAGYKVETLPPSDRESVEVGLKYTNNDICYPGVIVIGEFIKTLQSGKYDLSEVAIGFWETGGQCRATGYLSLLKRALISSGFEDIPVIAISTATKPQNEQPGFELDAKEFLSKAVLSIIFADALSSMYHATAIRELRKGEALELAHKYLSPLENGTLPPNKDLLLERLKNAVAEFNDLETNNRDYPVVGIVGEIYLKYNTFGNNNVAQWLMDQGIEVIIPPLMEFFSGWFVSVKEGVRSNIKKPDILWLLSFWANKRVQTFLDEIDTVMKAFRYYRPHHTIQRIAEQAQEIVSLTHQYGEGWVIAGEIGTLVEDGVQNVLCLQPFGCIANHVVAKGVGTRLKEKHSQLNLLYLDIDAGTSEVNFFNRMHFFVDRAKNADNWKHTVEEAAQGVALAGDRLLTHNQTDVLIEIDN
jgi:predicted nucleotide-binding protein (sugar kinase/HSP70/actin superfamily)